MAIIRVIFIFFALGGITAFLAFSVKPILFWLQNGYWSLANPPKMILLGSCFLAFHTAIGLGGLLFFYAGEKLNPKKNFAPSILSNNGSTKTIGVTQKNSPLRFLA